MKKLGSLRVVIRSLVSLVLILPYLNASCFNNSDVGDVVCLRIDRYNSWQWSTCVSNNYIRQKSKGRHGCAGGEKKCIYQCMLEAHDSNSGDIKQYCACPTDLNSFVLPKWCYSPSGGECNWYKSCLNLRYSGVKGFSEEVVDFAEQFCGLYLNAYSKFDAVSRLWVNGVRKCILVNFVPLLRPWHQHNSSEILLKDAMASFSTCYSSSFPGIPTICDLPLADLWAIFWHLRQTLPKNSRLALRGILRIIENCPQFREVQFTQGKVRKLVLRLTKKAATLRRNRFIEFQEIDRIENEIASEFCFDKNGVVWFSYFLRNTEYGTEIAFYIADKEKYMLCQKSSNPEPVYINNTISSLIKSASGKTFGAAKQYYLSEITVCNNFQCLQNNSWNITSVASSSASSKNVFFSVVFWFINIVLAMCLY